MLPGVGIFGCDPISKVLIQLLQHFGFEIHAIWTNQYEMNYTQIDNNSTESAFEINKDILTTSIDNVLLNKNVDLVFVCCQPSLHSQICSKALGIGKNVICCFPTCKDSNDIKQMISSAYYYPTLMSSIYYGGLNYITEFQQMKNSLSLVGDIKLCNINITCKNLIGIYNFANSNVIELHDELNNEIVDVNNNSNSNNKNKIEFNKFDKAKIYSQLYTNWNADSNLGGGILNRFGSSIISLVLFLFENKKISKINGFTKTFIQNIDSTVKTENHSKIRQLTADDYCNFQLNLEPNSVLVNVTINSLAQSKYNQEIMISGTNGCLVLNNSKLVYRARADLVNNNTNTSKTTDIIPPPLPPLPASIKLSTSLMPTLNIHSNKSNLISIDTKIIEKEIDLDLDQHDIFVDNLLKSYINIEDNYPELPPIFIKGLYYYLLNIKEKFLKYGGSNSNNNNKLCLNENLDNFDHINIVQSIISNIYLSSSTNKWICVNY